MLLQYSRLGVRWLGIPECNVRGHVVVMLLGLHVGYVVGVGIKPGANGKEGSEGSEGSLIVGMCGYVK